MSLQNQFSLLTNNDITIDLVQASAHYQQYQTFI